MMNNLGDPPSPMFSPAPTTCKVCGAALTPKEIVDYDGVCEKHAPLPSTDEDEDDEEDE